MGGWRAGHLVMAAVDLGPVHRILGDLDGVTVAGIIRPIRPIRVRDRTDESPCGRILHALASGTMIHNPTAKLGVVAHAGAPGLVALVMTGGNL